jgi:GNAT superfamily N-acetyltransferase
MVDNSRFSAVTNGWATEVRRAGSDDLDTLLVLVAEYCDADGHVFDEGVVRAGLEPLLADDSLGTVWMIDGTDGYAVVTWGWSIEIGGFDVVLDEIYVRTRGAGKGGDALRVIEADCRERGVKRIFLETERRNDAARRLYARHGYVADNSIWMSKELS